MGGNIKIRLIIISIIGGFGLFLWLTPHPPSFAAKPKGGENKPVLSPALFQGKTAYAYQIAKEIPEVLDSIYCYCNCQMSLGHKSLLSCYTDKYKHAALCKICKNQAIRAYELYKEGRDIMTIKKTEDEEFGGR